MEFEVLYIKYHCLLLLLASRDTSEMKQFHVPSFRAKGAKGNYYNSRYGFIYEHERVFTKDQKIAGQMWYEKIKHFGIEGLCPKYFSP